MAYLYFYSLAISLFNLFMLKSFDLAFKHMVLKDFFDSPSYFYISFIVVFE